MHTFCSAAGIPDEPRRFENLYQVMPHRSESPSLKAFHRMPAPAPADASWSLVYNFCTKWLSKVALDKYETETSTKRKTWSLLRADLAFDNLRSARRFILSRFSCSAASSLWMSATMPVKSAGEDCDWRAAMAAEAPQK